MKNKIIQSIPFIIVLIGIVFAPVSYWCMYSNGFCYGNWISHIYQYFTNPFYNFSLYLLPVVIILIFISRKIFNSWLKLAAWMLPLSFIFIATTPVSHMGMSIDILPFYRDDAARLAGGVVTAISLILIIWKYFSVRKISLDQPVS